jgi:hypothetical protein
MAGVMVTHEIYIKRDRYGGRGGNDGDGGKSCGSHSGDSGVVTAAASVVVAVAAAAATAA